MQRVEPPRWPPSSALYCDFVPTSPTGQSDTAIQTSARDGLDAWVRSRGGISIPRRVAPSGSTTRRRRAIPAARSKVADLARFGQFEDSGCAAAGSALGPEEVLPGKPSSSSRPAGPPAYRTRIAVEISGPTTRLFSAALPTCFRRAPTGSARSGPSGPRRLRCRSSTSRSLRGGICFCIDLDPAG